MFSFEETIATACAARSIPNADLRAADRGGNFHYARSFGQDSIETGGKPLKDDAVFWIASCTKLMTSIAALQCVERGVLGLDDDVSGILHEFRDLEVLSGFDGEGRPVLRRAEGRVTLRHLLTHTSGLAYDHSVPALARYQKTQGRGIGQGKTVREKYSYPLLYEPGTGWSYGAGIDWAGLMIERATNHISLSAYMETHLWAPLGITDMTFHLEQREDLRARLVQMCVRDAATGKAVRKVGGKVFDDPVGEAFGGVGVYASMGELLKVLRSVLEGDGKLLGKESVEMMFRPQLDARAQGALMRVMEDPEINDMMGGLPLGAEKNWGLAGVLLMEDSRDGRRKGSLSWGGLPNLVWWIDREAGLCGLYGTQILPVGDLRSVRMFQLFEREMYDRFSKSNPRL